MHTVIVGGGLAGVKMAKELSRYPNQYVVLVTKSKKLHGKFDYRSILPEKNITIINDTLVSLDYERKNILCESQKLHYDSLILTLGSVSKKLPFQPQNVPLSYIGGYTDIEKALDKVRDDLNLKSHAHQKYAVIGAGVTGIELAGQVAELVGRNQQKVFIIEKEHRILPSRSLAISQKAQKQLAKLGVKTVASSQITHIADGYISIPHYRISLENVFWATGLQGHPFFKKYPEIFTLDATSEPVVNDYFEAYRNIYVLSVTSVTNTSIDKKVRFLARYLTSGNKYVPKPNISDEQLFAIGKDWAHYSRQKLNISGRLVRRVKDQQDKIYQNIKSGDNQS
jgi:NADH dehydrogenase, FAD-containing subunit